MDRDREKAKNDFKAMSLKEKIAHIFHYYWLIGLICIGAAIAVGSLGYNLFHKEPEACVGIGVLAKYMDINYIVELPEDLDRAYPEFTEEGAHPFRAYPFYNNYISAQTDEAIASQYRMAASIDLQILDIFVGDAESIVGAAKNGYLMDLRELFTAEEYEMVLSEAQKRAEGTEYPGIVEIDIMTTDDAGKIETIQEDIPCIVCVTKGSSELDQVLLNEETYIGVVYNTPHKENVKSFILKLLGIGGDGNGA